LSVRRSPGVAVAAVNLESECGRSIRVRVSGAQRLAPNTRPVEIEGVEVSEWRNGRTRGTVPVTTSHGWISLRAHQRLLLWVRLMLVPPVGRDDLYRIEVRLEGMGTAEATWSMGDVPGVLVGTTSGGTIGSEKGNGHVNGSEKGNGNVNVNGIGSGAWSRMIR
jgi:hypothetical protein